MRHAAVDDWGQYPRYDIGHIGLTYFDLDLVFAGNPLSFQLLGALSWQPQGSSQGCWLHRSLAGGPCVFMATRGWENVEGFGPDEGVLRLASSSA